MTKEEKTRKFDYKDIEIARIFDQQEAKTSTLKISEILGIPARSIRYRISKLKENNILIKKIAITHERKLGLVERSFLVETYNNTNSLFLSIITENSAFVWYVPTSGKFNGYIVHSLSSYDNKDLPINLMEVIKKKKIIKDYYTFETADYKILGWNYDYFDKNSEWIWDWKKLAKEVRNQNQKEFLDFHFEGEHDIIDFDFQDIQILKNLYSSDDMTLKDFEEQLDLSDSQISRRIRSMEEKGIIKGYRTGFQPFVDLLTISCFFQLNDNLKEILGYISKIPYPITIIYQDNNSIQIEIKLLVEELKDFLNFISSIKNQIESYFLQFWHSEPIFDHQDLYDYFDEKTNNWLKLTKEYKKSLEKIKKMTI